MPEISTQDQLQKMHEAFDALKGVNTEIQASLAKTGDVSKELKAKMDSIQSAIDGIEAKSADRLKEIERKAAAAEALEARLAEIEGKMRAGTFEDPNKPVDAKAAAELRKSVYFKALRSGVDAKAFRMQGVKVFGDMFTEAEAKVLQLGSDVASGFLAPPEYITDVIMDVVEWSPIRTISRVRTTSASSVLYPKRTGVAAAQWVGEMSTRSETTNPAYGMEELPLNELHALIKVSQQDLEDSAFNLEAFLRADMAEQFGVTEGTALCVGNGVKKPEGITINASVGTVASGHATEITADGLIGLFYELKEAYANNAYFALSRPTLKAIRLLKDGQGNYLWAPGIRTEGRPAEILSRPYITCPDMPSIAASAKAVAYGDFKRAVLIVDRLQMDVLVDPYASKSTGVVEFSARRRMGAQVVQPDALKLLRIAAS